MSTREELQQFDYDMKVLRANKKGDIDTLDDIFVHNLDIHEIDKNSQLNWLHTALISATQTTPPIATLQFYLDQGLDVNAQDRRKNTALHYALEKKNAECALFLLQAGANPNIPNEENIIPMGMTGYLPGREDVVHELLKRGGDVFHNQTSPGRKGGRIFEGLTISSKTDSWKKRVLEIIVQYHPDAVIDYETAYFNVFGAPPPDETQVTQPPFIHVSDEEAMAQEIDLSLKDNVDTTEKITERVVEIFGLKGKAKTQAAKQVAAAQQAFLQQQAQWPATTDYDRLLKAFDVLFDQGIIALPAAGFYQDEAYDEVMYFANNHWGKYNYQGYCYFTLQSIRHVSKSEGLDLSFGPLDSALEETLGVEIGQTIVAALRAQGLDPSWDGTFNQRVMLPKFDWRQHIDFRAYKSEKFRRQKDEHC